MDIAFITPFILLKFSVSHSQQIITKHETPTTQYINLLSQKVHKKQLHILR